jgi:hypothetical protein
MNQNNLKMIYGRKERQDQLVIVLEKDQGLKFVLKVQKGLSVTPRRKQKNNSRRKRREKNNDQEADKNEEIHQSQ